MSAAAILEAFGGKHAVSGLTGASPNAVTQWRRIGIPSRYWHVMVEEAKAKRIKGITFEALKASKPMPAEAAA